MLQQWIQAARGDSPVWLDEVSRACACDDSCAPVVFELTLFDGSRRAFTRRFPRWTDADGLRFVREYMNACVFNILSALGGSCLRFYFDTSDEPLARLVASLEDVFQLHAASRHGYGKIVSEADRICAFLGLPPLRFECCDISSYVPEPNAPIGAGSGLAEKLRAAARRADDAVACGIDVGGTDIKLAVSARGKLVCTKEYDWNPAEFDRAEMLTGPVLLLARLMRACAAEYLAHGAVGAKLTAALDKDAPDAVMQRAVEEAEHALGDKLNVLDGVGLSFPDVVIRNAIVGGESPKTQGMRANAALDYDAQFAKITALNTALEALCRAPGHVRATNDGNIAAYTAAMELAHSERAPLIENGVLAHSLGTDLGAGWLCADCAVPELTLEMYDCALDLGSWPSRDMPAEDLRCVRNENSGLAGARRYMGQAAVFRMAYAIAPDMLAGYTQETGGVLHIASSPADMRKPCLEHIMQLAGQGRPEAEEIFRCIGRGLAHISRDMASLLTPGSDVRFLFGRFVKHPRCFALICEGCAEVMPELRLVAADSGLACTGLMRQLAAMQRVTVAQFGQAVGAVFYGLT